MIVYLNKDKFGLRYRFDKTSAWSYLPDKYQGKGVNEIKKYFTQNRENEPRFIFTDNKGAEAVFYKVNKRGGYAETNLDGKMLPLPDDYFLPYSEQITYLQQFSDRELDQDVNKLTSEFQKLQLLKKHASEGELLNLKEQLRERMTPEKITEFCKGHAESCYKNNAIVEF